MGTPKNEWFMLWKIILKFGWFGRYPFMETSICCFVNPSKYTYSGWWFGTCFIFPYVGNNHPNWLTNIFQRGWNHQPVLLGALKYMFSSSSILPWTMIPLDDICWFEIPFTITFVSGKLNSPQITTYRSLRYIQYLTNRIPDLVLSQLSFLEFPGSLWGSTLNGIPNCWGIVTIRCHTCRWKYKEQITVTEWAIQIKSNKYINHSPIHTMMGCKNP